MMEMFNKYDLPGLKQSDPQLYLDAEGTFIYRITMGFLKTINKDNWEALTNEEARYRIYLKDAIVHGTVPDAYFSDVYNNEAYINMYILII